MKKLLITVLIVLSFTILLAADKKPIRDVDIDAITDDTQVSFTGAGNEHMALAWWVPIEFWQAILAQDNTISETEKNAMLDAMSGVSLLAVVQADITTLGAFKFYSKENIEKEMFISFTDPAGRNQRLRTMQTIDPNLEIVLGVFKPILGAAMGNLGNNMHFYVLNDRPGSSLRLIDPYQKGRISIQISKRGGDLMTAAIEMPLNSLFVPRKCPNGKDAHISWKYCPWTGKRLED
jgi:hypothetical protein